MPGILHPSAHFLFHFRGCNRIKGCQQQGGPLSHLYFNNYVINNMCVYDNYWRVFKLEDVLCIEGISGTLFDQDIQTTCARRVFALHAKKALACPQGKKYVQKKCIVCILKQQPLFCIIMMET